MMCTAPLRRGHGRDGARPYRGSKIWFPTSVRTADPAVLGRVGSRVRTQNSNIVFYETGRAASMRLPLIQSGQKENPRGPQQVREDHRRNRPLELKAPGRAGFVSQPRLPCKGNPTEASEKQKPPGFTAGARSAQANQPGGLVAEARGGCSGANQ